MVFRKTILFTTKLKFYFWGEIFIFYTETVNFYGRPLYKEIYVFPESHFLKKETACFVENHMFCKETADLFGKPCLKGSCLFLWKIFVSWFVVFLFGKQTVLQGNCRFSGKPFSHKETRVFSKTIFCEM